MELTSHASIAVLSFSPPEGYPRLSKSVLDELDALLDEAQGAGLFRGVVIAANAKSFATGAEIEEVAALDGFYAREFAARGQATFQRIAEFPLPVVAAIRGYCLGGGLDLALACHSRVATYDSSFAHPGATLGLVTGWGGTVRLPRLVGKATALQMFVTSERVPATQALTMGLVNELAPSVDLVEAAVRRALKLSHVAA